MKKTKFEPKIHEFRFAILHQKDKRAQTQKKIIQTQKTKHKDTRKSNSEKS